MDELTERLIPGRAHGKLKVLLHVAGMPAGGGRAVGEGSGGKAGIDLREFVRGYEIRNECDQRVGSLIDPEGL